jgi:hypothetical protein
VQDYRKLARHCDRGAALADACGEGQSPSPQLAGAQNTREQGVGGLEQVTPQQRVAAFWRCGQPCRPRRTGSVVASVQDRRPPNSIVEASGIVDHIGVGPMRRARRHWARLSAAAPARRPTAVRQRHRVSWVPAISVHTRTAANGPVATTCDHMAKSLHQTAYGIGQGLALAHQLGPSDQQHAQCLRVHTLTAPSRNHLVRTTWARPNASFASVLLICTRNAALA